MAAHFTRFAAQLETLTTAKLRRGMEAISTPQGATVVINGDQLINFCSNDYLGLCNHPVLREAAAKGIARYGVGAGAAALLSGYSEPHQQLEQRLAQVLGYERALLFSSGYLANLGVIAGLTARSDQIFLDRLDHASIIDGTRLSGAKFQRFTHNNTEHLAALISQAASPYPWIITEGVFSMDGDVAPLPALANLARRHSAILVCDDAHGFGVMGRGRGTVTHHQLTATDVPIVVVTFGKALGSVGAAVLSSNLIVETLIHHARAFIYDTALPPALAHTTLTALEFALTNNDMRARLMTNLAQLHAGFRALEIPILSPHTPIQPIIIGEPATTVRVASELRVRGVYVRAVRPPTVPSGASRLRICVSAAHTEGQIAQLLAALRAVRNWF